MPHTETTAGPSLLPRGHPVTDYMKQKMKENNFIGAVSKWVH